MDFKNGKFIVAGLFFAALWASASTATKIGLTVAQPLLIAEVRFAIAATIMLVMAHVIQRQRLPRGKEWKQIVIFGALNISIYLGCYVIAMQTVTAGIGALAVSTNPVFISFLSVFFLKKKLSWEVIVSIVVCTAGVLIAAWPFFEYAKVDTKGLLLILFSMLSYSVASVYFSVKDWGGLSLSVINGWQTFVGGLLLLPLMLLFYKPDNNHFNGLFWYATGWLAIPVSIFAVQLWMWLLKKNALKAGLWLFLCPLFGFVFAAWLMKDEISAFTVLGVVLVIGGLMLSQINRKKQSSI